MTVSGASELYFPYMVAKEFPDLHETELIDRRAFLETIEGLLNETTVLFLESDEGGGATTTAAQFCVAHPSNSFALFVKPASRNAYSSDFIRLVLAEQYSWFLDGVKLDKDFVDESEFNRLQFRLRRKANKKHPIFFVIDGLHQISRDDFSSIGAIFKEVLPTGWEDFKFLIVGRQEEFVQFFIKTSTKYYRQLKFSLSESREFLSDLGMTEADIGSVHKLCDGLPGRLASVKRLISTGVSLEQIYNSEPSKYLGFVQLEFARLKDLTAKARRLLAILAFSNRQLPVQELLAVASVNSDSLDELIKVCSFLKLNKASQEVEFASEAHRRFAINVLSDDKNEALGAQIDYLIANPQSHVTLRFLPTYYQQVGQTAELVRLLSSDHFSELLDSTASIISLKTRAELGIKSAALLKQSSDVFSFSLKRSLFSSLAGAEGARSEIRALVAMGRRNEAMALAQDSVIREERFALLCTYARQLNDSQHDIEPEVIRLIRESAELIDFGDLGDRAVNIATDLVAVDASLAMSIVEQATKATSDSLEKKSAFARVAIAASQSPTGDSSRKLNEARTNISDENMQRFVSEMVSLVSTLSSIEVISVAETIGRERRLPFLCFWAKNHREDDASIDVVEYALDLMIDDSTYNPKMRDLRDLALPLAYASHSVKVEAILHRLDSQRGLIKDSSLSIDSVSLQITLAHVEMNYDRERAAERIIETYLELSALDNAEVKLECFAIMLEGLCLLDGNGTLEQKHQFRALVSADLQQLLTEVLANSADHFLIVKGALRALAGSDLQGAYSICRRLNLARRRDQAFAEVCEALYKDGIQDDTTSRVLATHANIDDLTVKDDVLLQFIFAVAARKQILKVEALSALVSTVAALSNPESRCRAMPKLVEIWANSHGVGDHPSLAQFDADLPALGSSWARVNLCFSMSSAFAKIKPDLGVFYYDLGVKFRANEGYLNFDCFAVVYACLSLTARTLHGALRAKCVIDDALDRYLRLVDLVPSILARIDLLSDLAGKAWAVDRPDISLRILKTRCIPAIDKDFQANNSNADNIIKLIFPSLYCVQAQTALYYGKLLKPFDIEPTVMETLDLILKRQTKSDPSLDEASERFQISYADALSCCTLIELLKIDTNIFWTILELCTTITAKINKNSFTRNQKEDLANRLGVFFRGCLPDLRNIQHLGYLILCEACVLTMRDEAKYAEWKNLADQGRSISNRADAGFVLHELAELMPSKFSSLSAELRKEVSTLFSTLRSPIDKINRLIQVSKNSTGAGVAIAKEQLRSAMLMTLETPDEDLANQSRRRIVDIAEKISAEFADELLELLDRDPARATARLEIKQRLRTLKVKRKLANAKSPDDINRDEIKYLPEAAWMNVAGLMTGRLETKAPELLIGYLQRSSALPLADAYPVLAWHIENATRKFAKASAQTTYIESLLEQMLLSSELAINIIARITARKANRIIPVNDEKDIQIGLNNRESAIDYIGDWIAKSDEQILLCDPYFGPDEIAMLRLVLANNPAAELTILTATKHLADKAALTADAFLDRWSQIMDQDPPQTKIIGVAYFDGGKSPIHDRWLISGQKGLRLGTSIGSVGKGKLSEISELSVSEVSRVSEQLQKFVRGDRAVEGVRIRYHSLTF